METGTILRKNTWDCVSCSELQVSHPLRGQSKGLSQLFFCQTLPSPPVKAWPIPSPQLSAEAISPGASLIHVLKSQPTSPVTSGPLILFCHLLRSYKVIISRPFPPWDHEIRKDKGLCLFEGVPPKSWDNVWPLSKWVPGRQWVQSECA